MPSPDKLGRSIPSKNSLNMAGPRRHRSADESQMAVTAIDQGGCVVTVISQLAETGSSENTPQGTAFTTSVHGGPLNTSMWRAKSWGASLRNHAAAVDQVINSIAWDADPAD
jgi:hypothetical protein